MKSIAAPTSQEKLAQLRSELRIGLPLQTEMGAFLSIEHLSQERFAAIMAADLPVYAIISAQRALDLKLSHDPARDAVLKIPRDYRFDLLKALADPALDLDYPGKGPLAQGELEPLWRKRLLGFCRSARALPAVLFISDQVDNAIEVTDEIWTMIETPSIELQSVAKAKIPLQLAGASQFHIFRAFGDDSEHYASIIGELKDPPLVRLHSACFTGDCLGSLKCDCGPQLHKALEMMKNEGGVLLYLSQEGRGIGLANKIRAYALQDQGFDTVEANHKLGFADDERDFRIGAEILRLLKIERVKLLTNNPRKIERLENLGIEVSERLPLKITSNKENQAYLATKKSKSGHLL